MSAPRVAMIMAAGLGTRMGALTADRPKPLLRAGGRALIDHALDRALEAGVTRAVVNLHWKADQLRAHLAARTRPRIVFSDESDQLLETGGGIVRALPLLGEAPFYTLNSDAVWSGPAPLARLAAAWDPARMDALLLLVPRARAAAHAGRGDFFIEPADAEGPARLARRGARPEAPFVHTGAQIIAPGAFADAPRGAFSTNVIWDRLLARGRLFGVVHHGGWVDVGTPAGLAAAEALLAEADA
ncbi:nucleotidyltransferase family protein [Oceanicella actignis]|uniref:MurNAc alpha-1-phosphate uridylyltransferase n=1 Tax=Oceanicella actignis TaxID=1189325 RepID=A0A1M7U0T0_9RHOB|nr:nucleotidyltransferase family protein [Oceanicella actignis]TYO84803.1 MurNAc alpha-1-phosphate uridylyltransferase [Oceanicella actignis]SET85619.1 MobA-like NTP transferase domain-containing protein [Oceanicella actignis]SHN76662.1 MurNAc alpha-1-phosphate uridylyltransferase [Oceanicella actignis]